MQLNVVGVGPQRSGTTWLYNQLRDHPQLCFPKKVKETFFFDERFGKGWSWYWSHFKHYRHGQLLSEIAPTYFDVPDAACRLLKHNPHCRIIVNLRNPAERTYSLYLHHRKKGSLNCEFREALRKMPRILQSSHYRIHLKRWISLFGEEKILVILLDSISCSPENVLMRINSFLGIVPQQLSVHSGKPVNVASLPAHPLYARLLTLVARFFRERRMHEIVEIGKRLGFKKFYSDSVEHLPRLETEIRKDLIAHFEEDIQYVENLLGCSLQEWRVSIK